MANVFDPSIGARSNPQGSGTSRVVCHVCGQPTFSVVGRYAMHRIDGPQPHGKRPVCEGSGQDVPKDAGPGWRCEKCQVALVTPESQRHKAQPPGVTCMKCVPRKKNPYAVIGKDPSLPWTANDAAWGPFETEEQAERFHRQGPAQDAVVGRFYQARVANPRRKAEWAPCDVCRQIAPASSMVLWLAPVGEWPAGYMHQACSRTRRAEQLRSVARLSDRDSRRMRNPVLGAGAYGVADALAEGVIGGVGYGISTEIMRHALGRRYYKKNPDDSLRALERAASEGPLDAWARLGRAAARAGKRVMVEGLGLAAPRARMVRGWLVGADEDSGYIRVYWNAHHYAMVPEKTKIISVEDLPTGFAGAVTGFQQRRRNPSLAASAAKEALEHPWLTPAQAARVARDHARRSNPLDEGERFELARLKARRKEIIAAYGNEAQHHPMGSQIGGLNPAAVELHRIRKEIARLEVKGRPPRPEMTLLYGKTRPEGMGLIYDVVFGIRRGKIGRDNFGKWYVIEDGNILVQGLKTATQARDAFAKTRKNPHALLAMVGNPGCQDCGRAGARDYKVPVPGSRRTVAYRLCGFCAKKAGLGRSRNPQDDEMRRLERAAAEGDVLAQQKIQRMQGRTGDVGRVESVKLLGEWNLVLTKSGSRWSYFLQNPQGGGGGSGSYKSMKAAIDAAIGRGVVSHRPITGNERVYVIQAEWNSSVEDYVVTKKPSFLPLKVLPPPSPLRPGSPEYFERLTRNNPRRRNPHALLAMVGNPGRRNTGPTPRHLRQARDEAREDERQFRLKLPSDRVLGTLTLDEARRRWGKKNQVPFCEAAFKDFHKVKPGSEVVIYDNGSKDYTFAWTGGETPEVTYSGDASKVPDGSVKGDAIYVHTTDENDRTGKRNKIPKPTYLVGIAPKDGDPRRPVTRDFMLLGHMTAQRGWLRR